MGAVSISIGRPSRRRRSSTLAASATISLPMPSPGSMAIFIVAPDKRAADRHGEQSKPWFLLCLGDCSAAVRSEEPRLLGFALRLERANLVGVGERERDVVESVQQAVLAKRVDVEPEYRAAVGGRDSLPFEVDSELESRECCSVVKQALDIGLRQHDRQQAVLEAIIEKDVGERRSDDGAESVVAERPRRMLARAAAAEVAASKQNLRALVARLVERKVRVRRAARQVHSGLARIEIA